LNEQLKLLIELQELDRRILKKRRAADLIPKKIEESSRLMDEATARKEAFDHRLEEIKKRHRDKERELEEHAEHIRKIEERVAALKTNAEYQAHLKEVEKAKEATGAIEEEILLIMEEKDGLEPVAKEIDDEMHKAVRQWETAKSELSKEKEGLETAIAELKGTRGQLVSRLPEDVYREYMDLMRRHNGVAVVGATREVCQGCHLNMPPQHFNNLRANDNLSHCPACNRIIYYKEEQT